MVTIPLLIFLCCCVVYATVERKTPLKQQISPIKEKRRVDVDPESQNTPLDPRYADLLPPPPHLSTSIEDVSIFVGLSAFRDGLRCGKTVFTGIKRATIPDRVRFGVVDQLEGEELSCFDSYCQFAKEEWPDEECRYGDQITIDPRKAVDSRGPTYARAIQQALVGDDDEFCLQLDAHCIFTNGWDVAMIQDWKATGNEMAVLSTYLHNLHSFVLPNGDNSEPGQIPHLCKTLRGTNGLVRNEGASMVINSRMPQMTALWGAGLSFSKCHAERRVKIDNHTKWVFDGEEFLRASHLWTFGYDMYTPSKLGLRVYHNYTKVPARFEHVKVDAKVKALEQEKGRNRFRLVVGMPFDGQVDAMEMKKFDFGTVRPFEQYLNFSGVTFNEGEEDQDTCRQLHWVPFSDPTPVERLLGDWKMQPETPLLAEARLPKAVEEKMQPVQEEIKSFREKNAEFRSESSGIPVPLIFVLMIVIVVLLYFNPAIHKYFRTLVRPRKKKYSRL